MNPRKSTGIAAVLRRLIDQIGDDEAEKDPEVEALRASLREHLLSTEEGRRWQRQAYGEHEPPP